MNFLSIENLCPSEFFPLTLFGPQGGGHIVPLLARICVYPYKYTYELVNCEFGKGHYSFYPI